MGNIKGFVDTNKMRVVVATNNKNKAKEIKEILNSDDLEVLTMSEAGIELDVEETGTTYKQNALLKGEALAKLLPDAIVIADDSGLSIHALNNEPGVYSARYLGEATQYEIKMQDLLDRLEDKQTFDRSATFTTAMSLFYKGELIDVVEGNVEGEISTEIRDGEGFAYDFFFTPQGLKGTVSTYPSNIKNLLSWRSLALQKIKNLLHLKGLCDAPSYMAYPDVRLFEKVISLYGMYDVSLCHLELLAPTVLELTGSVTAIAYVEDGIVKVIDRPEDY